MDRDDREHFKTMHSAAPRQPTGSRSGSSAKESPNSRHDPHSCLAKARAIFSCYRRDEAQDPDGFVANLALVLGDYPASIVDIAADPRTGIITAFPMGLPNVGQIRQFLQDKQAYQDRLQRYADLPKFDPTARLPRPKPGPGAFANVLVRGSMVQGAVAQGSHPLYAKFLERAKTADPREFEIVPEGIRVALGWIEAPAVIEKQFKVPTLEDLQAHYAPRAERKEGEAA